MLVRVDLLGDRGDRPAVDPDVEPRVDPLGGVDDAGAADDDGRSGSVLTPQHQATSAAASAWTPTGPPVSTS